MLGAGLTVHEALDICGVHATEKRLQKMFAKVLLTLAKIFASVRGLSSSLILFDPSGNEEVYFPCEDDSLHVRDCFAAV